MVWTLTYTTTAAPTEPFPHTPRLNSYGFRFVRKSCEIPIRVCMFSFGVTCFHSGLNVSIRSVIGLLAGGRFEYSMVRIFCRYQSACTLNGKLFYVI